MKKKIIITILLAVILLPIIGIGYLYLHAMFPTLTDARFRTYKQLYASIQIGDSKATVIGRIDTLYPDSGKRKRPSIMSDRIDYFGLFMNPEKWKEPNCEGIFLHLKDGKVVKKEYSRD